MTPPRDFCHRGDVPGAGSVWAAVGPDGVDAIRVHHLLLQLPEGNDCLRSEQLCGLIRQWDERGLRELPGGSATSPPRVSAEESTRPGRADEIGVFPVKPVTPRRARRRRRLAGVVVVSFIAGGCSPSGSGGGGPLTSVSESTNTCMVTPADDPVAFGSAWVKLTGDRPVTFRGTELLDAHGIELVEGALMPPGKLPQGTGVGFPFPPTTYRPAPVPPSVWNARLLPGAELRPSPDDYPVTVGLRLAGQVDHGTASGIRLTYSDRGRTRHVELPTALLVVSKSVYRNCGDAETALKKTPG